MDWKPIQLLKFVDKTALKCRPIEEHLDSARSASPIYYVHADEHPMPVIHGTTDHLVPFLQNERLVDAMEKAGAPFYFHTVSGHPL